MNNINNTAELAKGLWQASTSQTYYTKDSFMAPEATNGVFVQETTGPTLTVTSPTADDVVSSATLAVSGTVVDYGTGVKSVTIDGVAVTVTSGSFSKNITLTEGANTVTIVATDNAGNATTVTRTVTYTP